MTDTVSVVIPVQRGTEWNRERATNLSPGTRILIVEHDEGEWAEALNKGVEATDTDLVILSASDAWFDVEPSAVDFLVDLAWNVDVTYGQLVWWKDGKPQQLALAERFCPHRLRVRNYLPSVACVRREKYLEVGGVKTGLWDLWVRLHEAGATFKYVDESYAGRDNLDYVDPSLPPPRPELKASFYYQATQGCAYWRCMLPARYLPGQAAFNGPGLMVKDNVLSFPDHHGAAVFQYAGDEAHHLTMLRMQERGIRVLIEADDVYTHWFPWMMKRAGWARNKTANKYSVEQHVETVRGADGVIVTAEHLAKQYRKLNPNVFICPNQIDPVDWAEPVKPDDGVFRIGWFASASHKQDGKLIRRAMEWASEQPNVQVTMIGLGADNGKAWYPFRFRHVPWSNDFGVYRRYLGELDVGLCPIVGTPWAVNRSDLKALEYGMGGAYPVVSDQPPYDSVDVPKARTDRDFLRIIQQLVADRDGTRAKAREWREYVLEHRTVEANIDKWEAACTV